jgi:hypothetical protein
MGENVGAITVTNWLLQIRQSYPILFDNGKDPEDRLKAIFGIICSGS